MYRWIVCNYWLWLLSTPPWPSTGIGVDVLLMMLLIKLDIASAMEIAIDQTWYQYCYWSNLILLLLLISTYVVIDQTWYQHWYWSKSSNHSGKWLDGSNVLGVQGDWSSLEWKTTLGMLHHNVCCIMLMMIMIMMIQVDERYASIPAPTWTQRSEKSEHMVREQLIWWSLTWWARIRIYNYDDRHICSLCKCSSHWR